MKILPPSCPPRRIVGFVSVALLLVCAIFLVWKPRNLENPKFSTETRVQRVDFPVAVEHAVPLLPESPKPSIDDAVAVSAQIPARDWIKDVISETWIDAPQKLAGRQRVRVVEADFKYPRLRLEETVIVDPQTGTETVNLVRASVADHVLVGLREGVGFAEAAAAIREMGYPVRHIEDGAFLLVEIHDHTNADAQQRASLDLASLEAFIDHAEPDYLVFPCLEPNDPAYTQGKLWGLDNPGTTAGSTPDADVDAPEAWQIRHSAPDIVVAVTDTGINYNHEDLRDNMWRHPVDNSHGYDAYENDNDPMDVGGHGTHCAGTIGARGDNGIGLTGVAWEVQLMALRFLGPNGGATSDGIRVINFARENGAHVISASWGGGGPSQSLSNAIRACGNAGIPFIAAAGNSSSNNDSVPQYPANYDLPNIISVASTTKLDGLSAFSCYGRTTVDLGAPGSGIWSTYTGSNSSYTFLNGTSMATPHVTGAVALALAQFPDDGMETVLDRLLASVDPIQALAGKTRTGGRLNVARLLGGGEAPPSAFKFNNDFADAYRFEGDYGSWSGSNLGATREPDEDEFSLINTGVKSLWLAFQTPHSGLVTLDISGDALLQRSIVFEGGAKGELVPIAQGPILSSNRIQLRFTSKPGMEYRLLLDTNGGVNMRFFVNYQLSPPNDFFASATPINGDRFTATGYNRASTREQFEIPRPHADVGQGNSVWWRWTAPADLDITLGTAGSSFDTVLAVYTGDTTADLVEVASNDDRSPLDWTSQVNFAATAGTTYHIAVDSFRANSMGDIILQGFRSGFLEIIRQPASQQVEISRRAVFDVSVLSGGDVSYQWFFNNVAIPGQTAANLVLDPVRADQFGDYHVEVRNSESVVNSTVATLSERQSAPRLTWSSGNQAVASGTAVTLAATFSGSTPMTYAWTKNGEPHPGDMASLTFSSAQVSDAGIYRLTATNSAGSATADFTLSVVQSPWDRWEWRRPGIPNAAITDIKVYDGEAFAVSATTLLRSTDGVNWTKSVFPQGFTGNSIAKTGSMLLCNGLDTAGQFRVAISNNNGASWTISATTGHPTAFSPEKFSLIGFGGAFIAWDSGGTNFFRSTNGTTWTRLTTTTLAGTTANLTGNGRIASDGTQLILASTFSSSNGLLRFHKSTDGVTWAEHETLGAVGATSAPRNSQAAAYARGRFHLFETHAIYTSVDGVNWDYTQVLNNGYSQTSLFASTPDTLVAFLQNSQTIRYFSTPSDPRVRTVLPGNSHPFTAAAKFGDKILFGTDKGLLSLVDGPLDVTIPRDRSFALVSLDISENLLIARASATTSSTLTDLVSGDGVTWKASTLLDTATATRVGFAGGRYYGRSSSQNAVQIGYNPFELRAKPADDLGLQPHLHFIGELPNGQALATNTEGTGLALRARAAGSTSWVTATFPQTVTTSLRFASLGNRWYSFSEGSVFSTASFQTSTNGTTWTPSGLTGSNAQFVTMGGKSWCVYHGGTGTYPLTVASSTNGTSWINLAAPTGLPAISYQRFLKRVVAFGDYLVLLGTDENLYFSDDGVTWLRGSVPGKVVDMAAANGQLVAIMKNGGLIQTGSPHPGGSAPLVRIVSPQTASTHLIGSRVTIEGALSDPEDGTASYDCYMDGQLVASGTGNIFRFDVTTTDPAGHTVSVRARDSHGLRQIDAIRLKVAAAEPENLLSNISGGSIPGNHAVSFDGVFYAAGERTVHRSLDGRTWEKVPIPSFANSIYAMAAGNGALVIQFDNGGIMTTRDGVNWTHFQPNLTNYWVREAVRFSSGMFIAAYQTQGTSSGSVMTSVDGLTWEAGTVSSEGYLSWFAVSPDGTVIGAGSKFNTSVFRSRDGGFNWTPIAAISGLSPYNHYGMFAEGRFFVAFTGSPGKLLTSTDTEEWAEQPLPAPITNTPVLGHVGGLYFFGRSPDFSHVSADSVTWQAMSHSLNARKIVHSRGLFLAEAATGGTILSSRDGVSWDAVPGLPNTVSRILANEESYLVITTSGATWLSQDGVNWENALPGGTAATINNRIAQAIAQLNDRIVAAGNRLLSTSGDNGRTWQDASINGQPPSSNNAFPNPVSSSSEMLVFEGSLSAASSLLRSTDGIAFTTVPGLPSKTWADLAWNGSEWMMIATDGSLFRSTDGGLTWTQLAVSGIARGAAVAWFNNRWVVIGAALAGSNTPYVGFTLEAGDVLQNHGNIGFYNSNNAVRTLVAHGRLLIWTRGENTYVTSNGSTWAAANLNAGAGNHDYDIYHTVDGFTAFIGSTVAYYPVQAWSAGASGLTWASMLSPFNNIQYAENLGERIFLFTYGVISELHDKDLALTLPAHSPATLGVGDTVSIDATITNFGRAIPSSGPWKVTAWLAKNRFYGDTKNIPLGTFEITAPMPALGMSQSYPVSFTLPNEILTGDNYLILSLAAPDGLFETNTANNTVISDTAFVTIPEWEFSVATNGNGQVNRDFAAMRYPHNAQVSLTATAGKGAVFSGWGGDANSPNNQITILMDGPKSIQANFSNRATLQVFTRGLGNVTGLADLGSYPVDAVANVTAVPDEGWEFSHWSGAATGNHPAAAIAMNATKALTAHFVLPVQAWRNRHFDAAQLADPLVSGDDMDPDRDGKPNWVEYLHASDPLDRGKTGVELTAVEGGFLRCVYTRNTGAANGGSLTCQAARTMGAWNAPDLQERVIDSQDGIETIEALLPITGGDKGFIRFRHVRPSP